jgi:hypothetical protein
MPVPTPSRRARFRHTTTSDQRVWRPSAVGAFEQAASPEKVDDLARHAAHRVCVVLSGGLTVAAPARIRDSSEARTLKLHRVRDELIETSGNERGQRSYDDIDPRRAGRVDDRSVERQSDAPCLCRLARACEVGRELRELFAENGVGSFEGFTRGKPVDEAIQLIVIAD